MAQPEVLPPVFDLRPVSPSSGPRITTSASYAGVSVVAAADDGSSSISKSISNPGMAGRLTINTNLSVADQFARSPSGLEGLNSSLLRGGLKQSRTASPLISPSGSAPARIKLRASGLLPTSPRTTLDPFVRISVVLGDGSLQPLVQSEVCRATTNPVWGEFEVPLGDVGAASPLIVEMWDKGADGDGSQALLGSFRTTVGELERASADVLTYPLVNFQNDNVGSVDVLNFFLPRLARSMPPPRGSPNSSPMAENWPISATPSGDLAPAPSDTRRGVSFASAAKKVLGFVRESQGSVSPNSVSLGAAEAQSMINAAATIGNGGLAGRRASLGLGLGRRVSEISTVRRKVLRGPSDRTDKVAGEEDEASKLVQINQYMQLRLIGQGATAKVTLAVDNTSGRTYAIKAIKRAALNKKQLNRRPGVAARSQNDARTKIYHEIDIMKRLDHPNVVNLHEVIDDEAHDELYLVLDYVEGGCVLEEDDWKHGRRLDAYSMWRYARDIVNGLSYLHSRGIVHQDLKPTNMLLTADDSVKITDFGMSRVLDAEGTVGGHGTPAYAAPEALNGVYSPAVDLWSFGVCLFQFAYGVLPFTGDTLADVYKAIETAEVVFPFAGNEEVEHLILHLLEKDPQQRCTLEELREDPWITLHGRNPLPPVPPPPEDPLSSSLTGLPEGEEEMISPISGDITPIFAASGVQRMCKERSVAPGTIIVEAGTPVRNMIFVKAGELVVEFGGLTWISGPGTLIGDVTLCLSSIKVTWDYTVRAVKPAVFVVLEPEAVEVLVTTLPEEAAIETFAVTNEIYERSLKNKAQLKD